MSFEDSLSKLQNFNEYESIYKDLLTIVLDSENHYRLYRKISDSGILSHVTDSNFQVLCANLQRSHVNMDYERETYKTFVHNVVNSAKNNPYLLKVLKVLVYS